MSTSLRPTSLAAKRILLIEDEHLVAADITEALLGAGATVIGPVGSLSSAMRLARSATPIDAAMVDIQLHDGLAYPLIDRLRDQGVPILLNTGRGREALKPPYDVLPICEKPVPLSVLIAMLDSLCRDEPGIAAISPRCDAGSPNPS